MAYCWHILTGEYPPQRGGVADYSRLVARGLVAAGDDVFVWTPSAVEPLRDDGVHVRRLPDHFGPASLAQLERETAFAPGRLLLQYTPHAFGWKAMNVPLCVWLWSRHNALDVMFHEVAFPWDAQQRYRHRFLGLVQRCMASLLVRAAERIFVSIPGWEAMLKPLAARFPTPVWMPVPSNVESPVSAHDVEALRRDLTGPGCTGLVGHFGTYGPLVTQFLQPTLGQLLERMPSLRVLLLGHGSAVFANRFLVGRDQWAGRVVSCPDLDERAVSTHLAACDVLLQPYPDGICSRRGSAMAGISLGMPLVTTAGNATEPLWHETGAVAIAPANALAESVCDLLDDQPQRLELGKRARALYQARFAVEHTIRMLRQDHTSPKRKRGIRKGRLACASG